MWHKTNKKLPKKLDYYLISDGFFYSVGIFCPSEHIFYDRNQERPILPEDIKYWRKIPLIIDKNINIPNIFFL